MLPTPSTAASEGNVAGTRPENTATADHAITPGKVALRCFELEDVYCSGLPVLSPADGMVPDAFGAAHDMPVGMSGGTPARGHQLAIEVAPDQHIFPGHLRPGSTTVAAGDRVVRGPDGAQVDNSGNTSEPDPHIHLQDTSQGSSGRGPSALLS